MESVLVLLGAYAWTTGAEGSWCCASPTSKRPVARCAHPHAPQRAPAAAQAPAGAAPPCGGRQPRPPHRRPLCLAVSRAARSSTPTGAPQPWEPGWPKGAGGACDCPAPFPAPRPGPCLPQPLWHTPRADPVPGLQLAFLPAAGASIPPAVVAHTAQHPHKSRTAGASVDPGLCTLFPSQCIRRRGAVTGLAAGAPTPPRIHTAAAPCHRAEPAFSPRPQLAHFALFLSGVCFFVHCIQGISPAAPRAAAPSGQPRRRRHIPFLLLPARQRPRLLRFQPEPSGPAASIPFSISFSPTVLIGKLLATCSARP